MSSAGAGGQLTGNGGHVGTGGAGASGGVTSAGGSTGVGGSISVVEAGPAHWCDGQHALFCEDFDEAATVDAFLNSWATFSTAGGDFSFDSGGGVPSPPNALRIRTNTTSNVRALVAKKMAPFVTPPSKLRLEFSLRIDAASNITFLSGAAIAAIMMGAEVTDGVVALEIGNGPELDAAYLEPSGTAGLGFSASKVQAPFPTLNQWSGRYAVEIDYAKGTDVGDASRTGCVWVLIGGVRQLNQCLKLPHTLVDPPSVSVALGVYSGGLGNTGDVQLRFDNVILTAE